MAFYFTQLYGLYPIILQQIHYWLKDSKHKYDNKIGFIILFRMAKQFPFWSVITIKELSIV